MDKDFKKIEKAFKDISKTKEGHKIISEVYIHMKDIQMRKILTSILLENTRKSKRYAIIGCYFLLNHR